MADKPNERVGGVTREQWRNTQVARATSAIACNQCGRQFDTPHDFYDHKDRGECERGKEDTDE